MCRKLRALLTERGIDFDRVDFHLARLKENEIRELLKLAGLRPRDALRTREPVYAQLALGERDLTDDELIREIAKHPQLLQRPIVVRGDRAVLARPVDRVLELLD
jgi:arsenate reductase